jgi:hypothetical protein
VSRPFALRRLKYKVVKRLTSSRRTSAWTCWDGFPPGQVNLQFLSTLQYKKAMPIEYKVFAGEGIDHCILPHLQVEAYLINAVKNVRIQISP